MSITSRIGRLFGRGSGKAEGGAGAGPRVTVAAFGKHPGWDDHIEDIGLSSDALIAVKRWLYVEGIRTVIDGGAWEKLRQQSPERKDDAPAGTRSPASNAAQQAGEGAQSAANPPAAASSNAAAQLTEIAHVFLYRQKGDLIVGRMWASRDGKGRSQYPMIVCAHCRGFTPDAALALSLPPLARLEEACKTTTTAQGVRDAVAAAQRNLEAQTSEDAEHATANADRDASESALALLAKRPELGPERVGMHRILYQIEREMSAFRAIKCGATTEYSRSASSSSRARHMRAPACAGTTGSPMECIRLWLAFMHGDDLKGGQVSASTPIFLLAPLAQTWIDVIAGMPTDAELYCIRAGKGALPLTSDVPYTIDRDFIDKAEREIRASNGDGTRRASDDAQHGSSRADIGSAQAAGTPTNRRPRRGKLVGALVLVATLAVFGAVGYFAMDSQLVAAAISAFRAQLATDGTPEASESVDESGLIRTDDVDAPAGAEQQVLAKPDEQIEVTSDAPDSEGPARGEEQRLPVRADETSPASPEQRSDSPRLSSPPSLELPEHVRTPTAGDRDPASLRAALAEYVKRHVAACDEKSPGNPLHDFEQRLAVFNELSSGGTVERTATEWRSLVQFVEREQRRLADLSRACEQTCHEQFDRLVREAAEPGFDSQSLRAHWESALQKIRAERTECRERLIAAASLREALHELQKTLPGEDVIHDGSSLMVSGSSFIAEQRERLISEVLEHMDWVSERTTPPDGWDQPYRAWEREAIAYLSAAAAAQSALDEARDAGAIEPLPQDVEGAAELEQVLLVRDRLAALAALRESDASTPALVTTARDEDAAPELRFEAWRRLGARTPLHSLEHELQIQQSLTALLVALVADNRLRADRASELERELRTGARLRWITHAEAAADYDALRFVLRHRESIGVSDNAIEGDQLRFNIQLIERVQRVRTAADDTVRERAAELIDWLRQQPERFRAGAMVEQVRETIEAASHAMLPVDRLGPASAGGWRGESLEDGRLIRFTLEHGAAERSLLFRRIDCPSDGANSISYVLTHEVPVWLFALVAEQAGGWSTLSEVLEEPRTRRGPAGWVIDAQTRQVVVASQWLDREGSNCYAPRVRPAPPIDRMPAQFVSPAAAAFLSARLGCRLPTVDEWRHALAESGAAEQMARANLRGSAWKAQWTHLSGERLLPCDRPHEGTFAPTGLPISAPDSVWMAGSQPRTDNTLWYRPVDESGEDEAIGQFRNLVGNVAEFVLESRAVAKAFDELAADPGVASLAHVLRLLASGEGDSPDSAAVFVIGASSLSHPELSPETAYPISLSPNSSEMSQGYSDVGFRLAFSVPEL